MSQDVFVTNKNDFTHEDMYDGDAYVFPPGEKVQIPADAAVHMFGFNRKDKTETLVRLGWANKFDEKKGWIEDSEGVRKLANFIFTRGVVVEVDAAELEEAVPSQDMHIVDTPTRIKKPGQKPRPLPANA